MTVNASRVLELRIISRSVRIYPEELPTIGEDITRGPGLASAKLLSDTSICLLRGSVDEFALYSRHEGTKWLIDIAHDICDPADQRGSLVVWKEEQHQWTWCPVVPTDPLVASIYRYDLPDRVTVGLSKISQREGKSVASSNASGNQPSTMDDRVKSRDEQCWVTDTLDPVSNSRILPKRMGDHVARTVFRTFTSVNPSPTLSVDDEVFGLCLALDTDRYFDQYRVGFRFVSRNLYGCHSFVNVKEGYTHAVFGVFSPEGQAKYRFPALHGSPARPPHPERDNIPPPGLFRWHYLQCVIKKFAHDDYRELRNIDHYEVPLRMKGDSDGEDEDGEAEWPSKALDLGRVGDMMLVEREERRRAVVAWMSKV